ncbi:hypothetical protein [Rudaeicoccus suwonensis]|uniref:Class I SAM-dependent methyltransferase n=1 Tax=Rudaeicoccus suwonensis TaxID=657409 RepID=A0A561E920_9MICO|nr:hypothetical protein [Rudaeicoccus suwonensis]TWE12109.1 hypothetical protein BKA23_0905 [Rudaeicoccus suwonensis]
MSQSTTTEVVAGEMQPWTDYSGQSYAAGGPVLEALVREVRLSTDRPTPRVLIAGPHSVSLVRAVASQITDAQVTVLVRSATDAAQLTEELPDIQVGAGALDGFRATSPAPFDVVIALDGLDRLLSYDSAELSWDDTLRALTSLLTDDGALAIAHPLESAPANILDARPVSQRHGDDDWRPFYHDPTRPLTHDGFVDAVRSVRGIRSSAGQLVGFGPAAAPRLLADVSQTTAGLTGSVAAFAKLAADADLRPLLASQDELIDLLAKVGRISDAAAVSVVLHGFSHDVGLINATPSGTLAVATGPTAEYAGWHLSRAVDVSGASWPDAEFTPELERDTAQPSETARYVTERATPGAQAGEPASTTAPRGALAGLPPQSVGAAAATGKSDHIDVVIDESLLTRRVPFGPTVAQELLRLAELGDVPGFRDLAAAVGAHVDAIPVPEHRVVTLDNLVVAGRETAPGFDARRWSGPVGTAETLAAAFFLLQDRMVTEHRRHPWPTHLLGRELVATWTEMAGVEATDAVLDRARDLALTLAAGEQRPGACSTADLRTALADAQAARRELQEALGHIAGLERTIGFRDKQLRTREEVIRNLRKGAGPAGAVAAQRTAAGNLLRVAKRTAQVRSVGELGAGVERVVKRAQRARAAAAKAKES